MVDKYGKALAIGQRVNWRYETHRGWGASWNVPATILKIGPKRVQIAAALQQGGTKAVWVTPEKLTIKETTDHE